MKTFHPLQTTSVDAPAQHVRTRDVAKRYGVTVETVVRWIKSGKLHAIRFGDCGPWLIPLSALESSAKPSPSPRDPDFERQAREEREANLASRAARRSRVVVGS